MNLAQALRHLRQANLVAAKAKASGHHPFGALLVAPDHETVLAEQGNIDTVNHAESTLLRRAALHYPNDYLWGCTLVTTVEPCAMCAGTQYWAHVGRLVYGMSETKLLTLTGAAEQNPSFDLPCRQVFTAGQKKIAVSGPFAQVEDEIAELHKGFW